MTPFKHLKLICTFLLIGIVSVLCLGCKDRNAKVRSIFQTPQEYKYQEYPSEEECRAYHSNPYYACSQRISFDQVGRTEAIFIESDIVVAGQYRIIGNTIEVTINQERGRYILNFEIVSDSTIRRLDNHTLWARSK